METVPLHEMSNESLDMFAQISAVREYLKMLRRTGRTQEAKLFAAKVQDEYKSMLELVDKRLVKVGVSLETLPTTAAAQPKTTRVRLYVGHKVNQRRIT